MTMQNPISEAFDNPKDEFDDFDDFDDVTDAEWDELDDEPPAAAAPKSAGEYRTKKKSFFMRHFNIIVILLALCGAGVFVMAKFGGALQSSSLPQEDSQASADNDVADDQAAALPPMDDEAAAPPMPVPMDSAALNQGGNDQALTPLPDLSGIQAEPLPALDYAQAEKEMANENPQTQPMAEADDVKPPPTLAPLPVAEPESAPEAEDAAQQPPRRTQVQPAPTPTQQPIAERPVAAPVAPPPVLAQVAPEPLVTPEDLTALEGRVKAMNKELASKVSSTDAKLDKLIKSIEMLDQKIDTKLSEAKEDLQDQLKTQGDEQARALKKVSEIKAKPAPAAVEKVVTPKLLIPDEETGVKQAAVQPEVVTPAPAPKAPVVKKALAAPKASTQWVMRSAQPGKAVVTAKGSSDYRSVEVGNTLDGIGTIRSIAQVSGRWVIEGSKGKILQ